MPAAYTLGKDYTVSGLSGATDLTVTRSGERIDVSTRKGAKPFKHTVAGFPDVTFECTVYADATTAFKIGEAYPIELNGESLTDAEGIDLVCMSAVREEPGDGIVTYRLTFKPGYASDTENQIDIGPGTWRE